MTFTLRRFAVLIFACGFTAAQAVAQPPQTQEKTESIEGQFLSNIRQVTSGFVKAGEGYFSPDGKQIVYQAISKEYPFYQIYTQPLEGGTPKLVSTGRGRTTCAYFSPDGKKVLFASSHLDPKMSETEAAELKQQADDAKAGRRRRYEWPFDPFTEIFEVSVDGGPLKQITNSPGYDAEGAYSYDGKQIAFCSTRDGDPDLYLMNADGSDVRQLTNVDGYDGGPFLSPDGKWVCYRSDRKMKEHLQIHAISVDGKHDVALTDDPNSVFWAPYWHPTKPYLIWTGADHSNPNARPNYDLWLMKYDVVDGVIKPGKTWRETDHFSGDVLPVFSPDGTKLMWTTGRTPDHASQLWIADIKLPE
jgi:Tol biopolymer transport system component